MPRHLLCDDERTCEAGEKSREKSRRYFYSINEMSWYFCNTSKESLRQSSRGEWGGGGIQLLLE